MKTALFFNGHMGLKTKGLSALAKKMFILTNFLSSLMLYKCGWFVTTWQIFECTTGKNWTKSQNKQNWVNSVNHLL